MKKICKVDPLTFWLGLYDGIIRHDINYHKLSEWFEKFTDFLITHHIMNNNNNNGLDW